MAEAKKELGPVRKAARTVFRRVKKDNEDGARKDFLEQLLYDFNRSKVEIYWLNFFRGIFFGVGSVLGATIGIAILLSVLSLFADIPGVFGDFVRYIVETVDRGPKR